jgi:general secretion pathway protein G
MKFRCAYCKHEMGEKPLGICPACGRGLKIPDPFRVVRFRDRRKKRERIQRESEMKKQILTTRAVYFNPRFMVMVALLLVALTGGAFLFMTGRRPPVDRKPVAKINKTFDELNILRIALEDFRKDCERYPTTEEGLAALIKNPGHRDWYGPYVTLVKPDPWYRRYVYEWTNRQVVLLSLGPDGVRGTADDLQPTNTNGIFVRPPPLP